MAAIPLHLLTTSHAVAAQPSIEEVIVTAGFRDSDLLRSSGSISIIDAEVIRDRTAQHLEQLLNVAPNVNLAAGASRARFVQIRGIGERSQFVDPVDPSVGIVVDDIDISGLGAAATVLDIDQLEVLRGPQGTRYGASALAGMLTLRSTDPGDQMEGYVDGLLGNYDTWRLGMAVGGPVTEQLGARIALQQYRSDGYIENDFLQRDDTNQRDELTGRLKLNWQPGDDWQFMLSSFYVDIDSGYDAFSLDNTRHTLSDQPGRDTQQTAAASLKGIWSGSDVLSTEWIASYTNAELEYGFDEDWTYASICDGQPCAGYAYSSTDNYLRERDETRLELRALSGDAGKLFGGITWVVGVYANWRDENLLRAFYDYDLDIADAEFTSDNTRSNVALYAELELPLTDRLSVAGGLRVERFDAKYSDSLAVTAEPGDTLWGGELSLNYQWTDATFLYGLVSRGYKVGGVNGEALGKAVKNDFDPTVLAFLNERLEFGTETLVNWELGWKGRYLADKLALRLAMFYMDRTDIQVKGWYNEGPLFVGYIDNAASGSNWGAELETQYTVAAGLSLFANLGWLQTQIDDFNVLVDDQLVDKSGRDQAHAPAYQFNLGADVLFGLGFYGRIEVEGRDSFYFSDSHDEQSDSYQLLHARLGYRYRQLDVALWGRNLTDEDYQTRGFYFGNDPRKFYVSEAYYQYGEPRTFGVEARYHF
jgi:outer membrane receptor protein involved in Fe transport